MIATRAELDTFPHWHEAFLSERKDWRYYEIVNDTLLGFEFRYLELGGAIQPFFVLNQDLVAGAPASGVINAVRKVWPRFLKMRTLMVGCAAGEGHLGVDAHRLAAELPAIARAVNAKLIVMKEFPARYRSALSILEGFTRVPSMPMTRLDIAYENFDDFVA